MKEYECENCLNTEYIQDKLGESYKNGYDKAIDDFAERIIEVNSYIPKSIVKELAEQLKSQTEL